MEENIEHSSVSGDHPAVSSSPTGLLGSSTALAAAFTLTTFLSALLLFSIQPLFAKMVLPLLGGAPSVWAVALCFFQAALLAGYCWAHALDRYVTPANAGFAQLGVFLLAALTLPIAVPVAWREPPAGDPYLWQMGLFTVAVGLPFVAVAANAPLLQAWFSRTGHPNAKDPYFLYAASNLGSFIALLAYPFVLEPALGLTQMSRWWTRGFVVLGLAIALCFWLMRSRLGAAADPQAAAAPGAADDNATSPSAAPRLIDRLGWIGLALVPSALLTAFTTHVATDVASAPLIWVMPLALYLLTFVLVFRDKPWVLVPCAVAFAAAAFIVLRWLVGLTGLKAPSWLLLLLCLGAAAGFAQLYLRSKIAPQRWLAWFQASAVVIALLQLSQTRHDTWFVSAAVGVAAFFLSAMVAHRTLYEARPAPRYLTEFYLWMSLGGVLGGLFSGLVAPKLFAEVLEYPILLALTMACRPGAMAVGEHKLDDWLWLWLIAAAGVLAVWWSGMFHLDDKLGEWAYAMRETAQDPGLVGWLASLTRKVLGYGIASVVAAIFTLVLIALWRHPARQLVAAVAICLAIIGLPSSVKRGNAQRSYFGVYRVSESSDKEFQVLTHGTTLHGAQRIRDTTGALVVDTTPGTYYHPASPMAKSVDLVRDRLEAKGRKGRYGVVGLGSGSLTCYSKAGETWRIFEIDPVIVRIATDPVKFSYVSNCLPGIDIKLGDARLTMAKEASSSFDLIIVDAFSSDAIPVHLLTADAMRMFADKLTPEGILVLHISNRYLDLESVLAANIRIVPELDGLLLSDDDADGSYASTTSTAGVFSKSKEALAPFRALDMASEFAEPKLRAWTDDYSDILAPFLSKIKR